MKGQAALEFVTYFCLLLLLFTLFSAYFIPREVQRTKDAELVIGKEICNGFADEINLALQSDGYKRNFTFQKNILNKNYTLRILRGFVEITWRSWGEEFSYATPLLTKNITGLEKNGVNYVNISKGFLVVENKGGVIYLSQT